MANRLDKQGAASSVTAKCHLDVDDRGAAVLRGCSTMFSKKRSSMREKERKGDMQSAGEREKATAAVCGSAELSLLSDRKMQE